MCTMRTFVAVEIPSTLQEEIGELQRELKKAGERVSWTKTSNIHLTLKFLGNVPAEEIDHVGKVLAEIASTAEPFTFRVGRLGGFPNLRRPRVLWVGVDEPSGRLVALVEDIENRLHGLGFEKEKRKFSGHLTIGRVKSSLSKSFLQTLERTDLEGGEVAADEIVLMKSELHPRGAIYTPLRRIALGGGGTTQ